VRHRFSARMINSTHCAFSQQRGSLQRRCLQAPLLEAPLLEAPSPEALLPEALFFAAALPARASHSTAGPEAPFLQPRCPHAPAIQPLALKRFSRSALAAMHRSCTNASSMADVKESAEER
jgi:hypothetical protein